MFYLTLSRFNDDTILRNLLSEFNWRFLITQDITMRLKLKITITIYTFKNFIYVFQTYLKFHRFAKMFKNLWFHFFSGGLHPPELLKIFIRGFFSESLNDIIIQNILHYILDFEKISSRFRHIFPEAASLRALFCKNVK